MTNNKRDLTFDIAKFIAILMVIFWHLTYYGGLSAGKSWVVNIIIGFNMPLFFLIAGYFSRKIHTSYDIKKMFSRLLGYGWPILIFSLIDVVVAIVLYKKSGQLVSFWLRDLFFCFWFFFCLAMCDLFTFLIFYFVRRSYLLRILLLLGVFFIVWLIPYGLYSFISMVPFYWTGLLAFPRLYDAIKEKTWLCGIVGIFALSIYLLISFYEGDIKTNGMGFYWYKMSLLEFNVYGFFLMLSRYVMGIIGSLGLICLIRFLVVRVVYLSILSPFGQTTLGVYFVQRYIESNAVGCYLAQHYTYSLLGRVGIAIIVFLVCHAIVIGMNRNAYVRRLVWLKK